MDGALQTYLLDTSKKTFSKHFWSEITPKLAKKRFVRRRNESKSSKYNLQLKEYQKLSLSDE